MINIYRKHVAFNAKNEKMTCTFSVIHIKKLASIVLFNVTADNVTPNNTQTKLYTLTLEQIA